MRGVKVGDTRSGSAMVHTKSVALRKNSGLKRLSMDLGLSPSAAVVPQCESSHCSGGDVILAGPHGGELSRRPAEVSVLHGLGE